ncbi:EAL domain-containing protein [Devosia sp.]|uniref:putative bifunctional diguanylate cyclase/phosphodiesterase n=1 Tax=Devosia sp. TaxID=1871048 RepID=UPI0025F2F295|nr:EAL domain-containing protein [Devosia sp.]MCR6635443.1 EAL domain-containing protein [Devosia sp.]
MFQAAHKLLPPLDYVSMIRSLYADRLSMLLGAYGSALAASVAALEAQSPELGCIAVMFIVVGFLRHLDMKAFDDVVLGDEDVEAALYWEGRATLGAAAIALIYGVWCLISFWVVDDAFAELTAASVSVSVLVGVSQRNFAIDRLMTIQVLLIAVPLCLGLLLVGNIYYALLTLLLLPFFLSLRKIAGNARNVLLRAVHGRTKASALAGQLDAALDTMAHGLLMLDRNHLIEVANDSALMAFGIDNPTDWIGRPLYELFEHALATGAVPQAATRRIELLIETRSSGKVLISSAAGQYFEASISSRDTKSVLLFEDISDRIAAEERISYMARYDALTGLPNRAYFAELVEKALEARLDTFEAGDMALLILDIDDFKHINDTLGHLAGDQLLHELGQRLPGALPANAIIGRLGGDEFIAFYVSSAGPAGIEADAERLIASMHQAYQLPNRRLDIDVSVGLVSSPDRNNDFEQLMIKADLALNAAKSGGKNRIMQFHTRMDTEYQFRQQLKTDLKTAIAEGKLHLAYQPVVDPRENRIVGCEALARWDHETFGAISPATFIPIAEETGMITDLTRFVLAKATRDCHTWPGSTHVAVNISAHDFRATDVEDMVSRALEESGLPAARLEIEVTETTVIEERDAAAAALLKLCKQGVGVALDDFGTGYSSLSYLSALPFTKLKIDRSFLTGIETDEHALKLLTNVVQIGKDLDLVTTIEGVETEVQLNFVTNHTRADLIQGFLYGAPMSFDAISRLLEQQIYRQNTVPLRLVSST